MKKTLITLAIAGILSTTPVLADINNTEMDTIEINTDTPNDQPIAPPQPPPLPQPTSQLPSTSPETKPTSSVGNAGNTKPIGTDKGKTDMLQR